MDALPGIRRALLNARGPRGVLYQAFLGEVSPLAIGRHVARQVAAGSRSVTAGGFQLAELIAVLRDVATQAPDDAEPYAELCAKARSELEALLEGLRREHPDELGGKSAFGRYASRLQGACP